MKAIASKGGSAGNCRGFGLAGLIIAAPTGLAEFILFNGSDEIRGCHVDDAARIRRLVCLAYIIKTARTKYTKTTGFEVEVSGRLYDGKSATEDEGGKNESGGSSDNSDAGGKVAPNSAPGTPATPSAFLTPRRFGRTDEN